MMGPALAEEGDDRCGTTPDMLQLGADLPAMRSRIEHGESISVIAIGSSSTAGQGASHPDRAYPAQLEKILRQSYPKVPIRVQNMGRRGENAIQTSVRIRELVLTEQPHLMLWQLGANDAVRSVPLGTFTTVVEHTIDELRAAAIEVIMVPPQYAPRIIDAPSLPAYRDAIHRIAMERQVPLFQRFEILRSMVAGKPMSLALYIDPDNLHHTDLGYRCLALQLAHSLQNAMRPKRGTTLRQEVPGIRLQQ